MRDVERLLTAAMVEIVAVDPEHPDARQCLRSYFAELERRSGAPFDPLVGCTAEPHELRPPTGEMVVAYLRDEPVGCGALKHSAGARTDIKRMWLAEAARGLGLGRRLLADARGSAPRAPARAPCGSRPAICSTRRSRSTARPATTRCPPSTTSRSPTTGSRSAA